MKKYPLILILGMLLISCSEHPAPAYPNAGLRISSGGHELATSRIYSHGSSTNGFQANLQSNNMDYSKDGHIIHIEWTPNFASSMPKDSYHFSISVDAVSVMSFQTIRYTGVPIVLLETPVRVELTDVLK
jgi:hypothetical protein